MPADETRAAAESAGWLDTVVKILIAVVSGAVGWVWRTSDRQTRLEMRLDNVEKALERVNEGLGRVLNKITHTDLHDGG